MATYLIIVQRTLTDTYVIEATSARAAALTAVADMNGDQAKSRTGTSQITHMEALGGAA